jgi:octaprenyl-diphosphate synthase
LTLCARLWSDRSGVNPTTQKPSLATLAQMFEPIRDDLRRVEGEFARHVQSQVDVIPAIGQYIQDGGGKRIRPAVLLMAARMCGCTGDAAVLYASVVEFIHTATLVHDDIIDESDLRRAGRRAHQVGQPRHGALRRFPLSESMSLALSQDRLAIIRELCDVTLRIVEGRSTSSRRTGSSISPRKSISRSSAARRRISSPAPPRSAACWAGHARAARRAVGVRLNIGMAFQLVDDLLDFTGEEERLGKPVGGDLRKAR